MAVCFPVMCLEAVGKLPNAQQAPAWHAAREHNGEVRACSKRCLAAIDASCQCLHAGLSKKATQLARPGDHHVG